MTRKANQEIEIKLHVTDVPALRRCLKQLRARLVIPRTYESNTLYDTPRKDLARRGQLIRIRIEQPSSPTNRKTRSLPPRAVLTYKGAGSPWSRPEKGPPQSAHPRRSAIDRRRNLGRYKVREEVEIAISNGEHMRQILSALGLHPLFRYEKFRTTYAISTIRRLKIELDETPIGTFLELEGSPMAIDRAARLLGYSHSDYITQTYGALYIAHSHLPGTGSARRRHSAGFGASATWTQPESGSKPADMLFPTTK